MKAAKKSKKPQERVSKWNPDRLRVLLDSFQRKKILVLGDIGLDRYTIGSVERISQEAPVPIVWVQQELFKLGLAANVADNIQALQGEALLIGVVGDDRTAEDFRDLLKKSHISDRNLVVDSSRRTVMKERIVSDRQQLLRVDYESPHRISPAIEKTLLREFSKQLRFVDVVVLEDYAKGMLSQSLIAEVFRLCVKAKKRIAVDPNSKTPLSWYQGAWLLTPNTREAQDMSGIRIFNEETLFEAASLILKKTGAEFLIITRGKEGMAIFSRGSRDVHLIPTYAQEVFDVSGAGDTVIAVLALAMAAGATLEEAAVLGNLAAGVEVGKRGTATVTSDEILNAMEKFPLSFRTVQAPVFMTKTP